MAAGTMLTLAAFGAGLLATLVLAAWLTPRAWWRRANLRALTVLAGGTAAIGGLLLWLGAPPQEAHAAGRVGTPCPRGCLRDASVRVGTGAHPAPGKNYVVYRDLNLRADSGVQAPRLAVVPAGASVTATGREDGDWWQVSAQVDGRALRGWASSLWLRRADELRPGPPAPAAPSD